MGTGNLKQPGNMDFNAKLSQEALVNIQKKVKNH